MFDNRFLEFFIELARALLVDGLSDHVRKGLTRLTKLSFFYRSNNYRSAIERVHRSNRKRLLHRLLTELGEDP
jgi:hypothetical protein